MKRLIKDVYNICNRIKKIDKSYMLAYDFDTKKYMVYSTKINFSFEVINNCKLSYVCTLPYNELDARSISYLYQTKAQNFETLIKQIDEHNNKVEKENRLKAQAQSIEVAENKLRQLTK